MIVRIYMSFVPILVTAFGYNCPYQKCDCFENTISCDFDELTTLPELYPLNSTTLLFLSLNNNQLKTIQARGLPAHLYGIDFGINPIETIDESAFDGLSDTLTDLSFSVALFRELPRAFLHLNNLKHLTIADMQITTWDVDILNHIGSSLESLILNNVGLTKWPTWIQYLPRLGTLVLSGMTFQVPDDAFNNQINTLFSLNFENCSLTEIPNAVSTLTKLKNLVMDSNQITRLSGVSNSTTITTLSLDNNNISDAVHLSESLRSIAGSLTFLQLRNNKLTALPDVSALTNLDSLFLTQNAISLIGSSKMPSSLKALGLEYNNIPSLYYFMQTGTFLTTLRFHSNLIRELRGEDIPVSVSDMDVDNNLITELTDTSFPSNSAMSSLTLDFNPISKISTSAFENIHRLSYLSMMNTKLTRLPLSLSALVNLNTLDFSRIDGLICTCLEKNLRYWSMQRQPEINGNCGMTTIHTFLDILSVDCPD